MKKITSIGLLGLSFTVFFSLLNPAFAASDLKRAILVPGNPLYFIKEFSRNVQRTLAVDTVSKAELELGIADSFASEMITVSEEYPEKVSAAVEKYSAELDLLEEKISAIRPEAEGAGRFLDSLAEKTVTHNRLLSGMSSHLPESVIEEAKDKIASVMVSAEKKVTGGYKNVPARLYRATSDISSVSEGMDMLGFLVRFGNISGDPLSESKDSVVMRIDGMVRSSSSHLVSLVKEITSISIDGRRLRLAVEIKERTSDVSLRNRLESDFGIFFGGSSGISSEEAAFEIAYAENIEDSLSSIASAYSSDEIMPRIDTLLSAARGYHAEGDDADAFTLARTASVVASRYLFDLSVSSDHLSSRASSFKEEYEDLLEKAEVNDLSSSRNFVLWSRFSEAEKALSGLQSPSSMRESEKLISELKTLIADLLADRVSSFCPAIYDPVCGESGVTYSNSCVAASFGVPVKSKGACK